MSAAATPVALRRDAAGRVVIFDGVTAVRIDPATLPTPEMVALDRPKPARRTTLGSLREWCEPTDGQVDRPGRICGVVVDPAMVWRAIGQVLGALSSAEHIGLARGLVKETSVLVVIGSGWEAVIAGLRDSLDPQAAAQHPSVELAKVRAKAVRS